MSWVIQIGEKDGDAVLLKHQGVLQTFATEEIANKEIDWLDENKFYPASSCKAIPYEKEAT